MNYTLHLGDCLDVLRTLPDNSIDAAVCDPPYGFSFMGKAWDYDVPSVEIWRECLRVLKPGGHLLAFAGTRTQHRMAVRIEDAGFEIRDMIAWVYGSGFPKSLDVSKAIDRMDASEEQERRRLRFTAWVRSTGATPRQIDEATGTCMGGHYTTDRSQPAIMTREHLEACRHLLGDVPQWVEREADIRSVESRNMAAREVVGRKTGVDTKRQAIAAPVSAQGLRATVSHEYNITAPATPAAAQWSGWGTALKPALEPVTVARKPLSGTVAANVLQWGTGALNVDGCRVGTGTDKGVWPVTDRRHNDVAYSLAPTPTDATQGRWPANLIHDGSAEVVGLFPVTADGSNARLFYQPKASKLDRDHGCDALPERTAAECVDRTEGSAGMNSPRAGAGATSGARNFHPTVKPTDLMRYLCRLVTPPGGTVLDPFVGSGSTGRGAVLEGFAFIGIDRDPEYLAIAEARIAAATQLRAEELDEAAREAAKPQQLSLF